MGNINISDDQNRVTVEGLEFKFNAIETPIEEDDNSCFECQAFQYCTKYENTVPSTFPFPCHDRKDGKHGNFLAP